MQYVTILGMSDKLPAGCNCFIVHCCEPNVFKGGHMIRHRDTLDIDLAILNVHCETDSYIKLKVLYFNRNYQQVVDLKSTVVKIKASDKHKWSFVKKHHY